MQTLGLGFTWEELSPGQRFRTLNRTVTETDLVLFTGVTGMLEIIFTDRTFAAEKGRYGAWRNRDHIGASHLQGQSRHRRVQDRREEQKGRGRDDL